MSIRTENLTYIYGVGGPYEKKAIDDINIEIKDNEFIGIIGHTGSGKSTLIQHLNGLIKPTSGRVLVDGVDVNAKSTNLKEIRAKVGLVFQYPEYQLFEETVYKDIAFGLNNFGLVDNIEERILNAAQTVGLEEEILYKSPFDLSGGQKRKAAIAGVLALNPKYLILDEPAAGLDPQGRNAILKELYKIYKEQKITVVLVSHSMEDISKYADRILVMNKGRTEMFATPEDIYSNEEYLSSIGLDIPSVSKVLNILRNEGYDIKNNIFSIEDAADALYKLTGGKNVK